MDPCRQISVKLLNLKDDQGRMSETPHFADMTVVKKGKAMQMGSLTSEAKPYKAQVPRIFSDKEISAEKGNKNDQKTKYATLM